MSLRDRNCGGGEGAQVILAEGVEEDGEVAARGDLRIKLADRAGGSVAGVGEEGECGLFILLALLVCLGQVLVEVPKDFFG